MNQMSKLDTFIQQAVAAMPISGTSLIASLYGDALLQRGGEVWLGSVAALLEGLGFGERFVRTALFRLNKEEWLDVVRIGRRSFYRLSDKGLRLTRRAEHKIYRASAPEWDGTWLLLLSEGLEKSTLAEVKKQLLWQGFGALAPSLPLDGNFPFVHLERKFMHLGFHIYDVGFQSPNVEAARPLVYATSFLLVTVIVGLNLTAIGIRNHLREKFRSLEH